MNIQYFHNRHKTYSGPYFQGTTLPRGGETIAIESLKPWVVKTLTVGDFFTRQIGKARCSDEDNYNKATGRELAKSRMKAVILTVVELDGEHLVLQDEKKNRYTFKGSYFVGYNEHD